MEVPGLGERFGAEVHRVTHLLLDHPNIGREVGLGRRKFSLHRFPFTLIYAPSPEMLHVLADNHDVYSRAAYSVDRILKGARPADIPIDQVAAVRLVVNRRAANALGIEIPESVLLRSDELIQ